MLYNKILQGTLLCCWHEFGALFQQKLLFEHTEYSPIYVLSSKAFCTSAVPKNYSFVSLPIVIYILMEGEKLCCLENIYGNSPYLTPQGSFLKLYKYIFLGWKWYCTSLGLFTQKHLSYLRYFPFPLPSASKISNKAQIPLLRSGVTQMTLCSTPQNSELLENKDADTWKVLER